jgi:hypothetical protein
MASKQGNGDGAFVGARSHQPMQNTEMKRNLEYLGSPTSNVKVSTQVCFCHVKNKLLLFIHTLTSVDAKSNKKNFSRVPKFNFIVIM